MQPYEPPSRPAYIHPSEHGVRLAAVWGSTANAGKGGGGGELLLPTVAGRLPHITAHRHAIGEGFDTSSPSERGVNLTTGNPSLQLLKSRRELEGRRAVHHHLAAVGALPALKLNHLRRLLVGDLVGVNTKLHNSPALGASLRFSFHNPSLISGLRHFILKDIK